ncbi:hypothetical protein KR222_006331 [Zaprionus bogoriensis]|nr:hypothetical protein KR222_006331 [Zaprionus bogoriensis]
MGKMSLVLVIGLIGVALLVYKWIVAGQNDFKRRGLSFEKPWPIVGNNLDILLERCSMQKVLAEFYARNRHHKVVGFFNFLTPMIVLNDPEAIKQIAIKDFDHFTNHQVIFPPTERLASDMLSALNDQRWKHMRNTLTPAFTASKMRAMFGLMNDCFAECMQHLGKLGKTSGAGFELEMKEVCNRMSNDLIASTAFGLQINSYKVPKNDFYVIGQALAILRGFPLYKLMFTNAFPGISDLLRMKVFDQKTTNYFIRLVVDAMKYREQHNIVRPDMIQMLMEAKKESSQKWTDDEIVSQCFTFFFAAFENNAGVVCTTSYELLLNPDVQQRLYEEVKETHDALNGQQLSYDVVMKMKYMDMVVSESLRKWSLAALTDRVCTKDYTLRKDDGTKVFDFKKGDRLIIPISGLHMDDQYFPNPHKFDPERFSEENKDKLVPYTYIPFGVGPRICIGNRYALMTCKAMLFNLLLKYRIERSPKTSKDLFSDSRGFLLGPKDGFWVHMVPR